LELSQPPRKTPASPAYSTRQTKGQSVAAFFAALLRARPAGPASTADPSRENAAVATSSSEVNRPRDPGTDPNAAPGTANDAAVSFDDLFGTDPSSRATGSDQGKEDLDQFQTWLQNLKR
jgi:hypothetical protein